MRQGTHRSQPLDYTIRRVMRLASVMGITRVANVTGLDSVGIPVVMVCRPNSRSVAVSQGKGIDLASARASGLMEAAELYHAETITLPLRLCTYEELRYEHNVVDVDELPRGSDSRFHPNLRLLWCQGHDLLNGESVFVPYEMVHTNYTTPFPDGHGCFAATSNGLASGNNTIEAISHGLCEVVERDAATLWELYNGGKLDEGWLDLMSVDDRTCQQLIAKLECAGLIVRVWDMTTDIPIAAFVCLILPRDDHATWHCSVSIGYGCHPSREIALARALTEAAQCRLTVISGARDDIARESYKQRQDFDFIRAFRKETSTLTPTRTFSEVPTREGKTVADDVAWELKCIRKVGVKRVIVVDLTKPHFGLSVVRVIIPGMESILEPNYVPGRRALRTR
ncbi:MAG TPA: YcaO-like family protein [Candidatus Dormibacteraeota bacterium]|nr:YcaO-like family protein [Candidatus Dormibacteraeota bacterium]